MSIRKPSSRASTSFSGAEVTVLDSIFSTLLRGGDAKLLLRSGPGQSLMQKFSSLRKRIEAAEISGKSVVIHDTDPSQPS